MDYFDKSKNTVIGNLKSKDKSRKGSIDDDALPVISAFNSKHDYYTTSSCSGRINLFYESSSGKKYDSGWLFVKHGTVSEKEILGSLKSLPDETVWFRQESPIFHVACRSSDAAKKLIDLCMSLGFKRSGIISDGKRVMVEIIFNDKMDVPIASGGDVFVDNKFICFLVEKANEKMCKNDEQLKKFVEKINAIL